MSGEKIQRWDVGILRSSGDCDGGCHLSPGESENGEWMNSTDVLAALASRDATIKTQGETIAELRASVESKTAAIGAALEQMHGEDWAWCIPEIKAGLSAAFVSSPAPAPTKGLEWRITSVQSVVSDVYRITQDWPGHFIANSSSLPFHAEAESLRAAMLACELHAAKREGGG